MDQPKTIIGCCITCEDVFPEMRNSLETLKRLLSGMDKSQILLWCSRINLKVWDTLATPSLAKMDPFQRFRWKQELLIKHFFSREEIARIDEFFRNQAQSQEQTREDILVLPTVFFRGQVLELIRWACLYCPNKPGQYFDAPGSRTPLTQALLISGFLWNRRMYGPAASIEKTGNQEANREFLATFKRSRTEDTSVADWSRSFVRGQRIFCDLFPGFYAKQTGRDFKADFQAKTGMLVEQYYDCLAFIIAQVTGRLDDAVTDLFFVPGFDPEHACDDLSGEFRDAFRSFLSLKSQSTDELRQSIWGSAKTAVDELAAYSILSLVRKPIVQINAGCGVIIDPDCLTQSALLGPLFEVLRIGASINSIFGAFGEAFQEYCSAILAGVNTGPSGARISCRCLDEKGAEICDASIASGDVLVLMEIKSSVIPDMSSNDGSEKYVQDLLEKYVSGKDRGQGVTQLANAIAGLIFGSTQSSAFSLESTSVVIPVLLVRDSVLEDPVHAAFLSNEFAKALEARRQTSAGRSNSAPRLQIEPLVIVTVDILEDLDLTQINLAQVLRDYTSACRDRLVSLRNFVGTSNYVKSAGDENRIKTAWRRQLDRLKTHLLPKE